MTRIDFDYLRTAVIPATFDRESRDKVVRTCQRFLTSPHEPFLTDRVYSIVDREGVVIGITGLYQIGFSTGLTGLSTGASRVARLGWFGLAPQARGGGLGRAALRLTEQLAWREGHRILTIETSSNPQYAAAGRLYSSAGYRNSVHVRDYFGPGRHLQHLWRAIGPKRQTHRSGAVDGIRPLTRSRLAVCLGNAKRWFGDDAEEFSACAQRWLDGRRETRARRAESLVRADFAVVQSGGRVVGAIGSARYLWIASDVAWIRWAGGEPRVEARATLLRAALEYCRARGARLAVIESAQRINSVAALRSGFHRTSEIPDVYMPHAQWRELMRNQRRELAAAQRGRTSRLPHLLFQMYSKALAPETRS